MPAARAVFPARVIALLWVAPPGRYAALLQLSYGERPVDPATGRTASAVTPPC
jgi:hypothetical protein